MNLDQGIAAYLAEAARRTGPAPADPDVMERRQRMEALAAAIPGAPEPGVTRQNWYLPAPGREIPLRIHRPAGTGAKPLILYFHGGGWVLGSLETHDYLASALARETDSVVVSVHYRRAPENPHPAPLDDCYVALLWAAANSTFLGTNGRPAAVAGDSAGAHLATSCALRARDEDGPRLAFQLLIYPMVEPDFSRDSYRDFAEAPGLTRAEVEFYWHALLGGTTEAAPPSAVPSRQSLHDLPPAYVVTAEFDPLRDEGEAYADALIAAGVAVQQRRARGLIHGFMRAAPFSPAVLHERDIMFDLLRRALSAPAK